MGKCFRTQCSFPLDLKFQFLILSIMPLASFTDYDPCIKWKAAEYWNWWLWKWNKQQKNKNSNVVQKQTASSFFYAIKSWVFIVWTTCPWTVHRDAVSMDQTIIHWSKFAFYPHPVPVRAKAGQSSIPSLLADNIKCLVFIEGLTVLNLLRKL